MAAYALVRFPFRVKLASGIGFFLVALCGYLAHHGSAWGAPRRCWPPSRWRWRWPSSSTGCAVPGPILGNEDIIFWFVSQRMFPPIVTAFALYLMYTEIGRMGFKMVDTFWGLTLCYVAFSLPIVIWLMRDFFQALPVEVEEAAMVDNVPSWRIFTDIVVPMSLPG